MWCLKTINTKKKSCHRNGSYAKQVKNDSMLILKDNFWTPKCQKNMKIQNERPK